MLPTKTVLSAELPTRMLPTTDAAHAPAADEAPSNGAVSSPEAPVSQEGGDDARRGLLGRGCG